MKNKLLNEENIVKLLMIFLIIQPILDIYLLYEPKIIALFGFSPSTIIRIGGIGILILLAFFTTKFQKKHFWIVGYLGLVGIYVILHHVNAMNFQSKVEGGFGYSVFSELFYIIRMLLPLVMVIISKKFRFNDQKIETLMRWLILLISGSIVVTNLLLIGRTSYANGQIALSMPMWFIDQYQTYSYTQLASKGFFNYANQIAALLLLLTPIWFYTLIKRPNKINIVLTIIHICAMFILGTKVSTIGIMLLLFIVIFIYLFFCFIKKELFFSKKTFATLMVSGILCICIVPFCPALNRNVVDTQRGEAHEHEMICTSLIYDALPQKEYKVTVEKYKPTDDETCPTMLEHETQKIEIVKQNLKLLENESEKKQYLVSFIQAEYRNFSLIPEFVETYSYKSDPDFWFDKMQEPLLTRTNFRYLEYEMLSRVKQYNDSYLDDWFGITYVRMNNIFNLERDFISHYYTLGIVGLILFVSPYFIIALYAIIKMLCKHKEYLNFYNVMLLLATGITLFAAYYSGNVMDALVVTLLFGFFLGQFLIRLTENEKPTKKVSVIMPTYNDSESIIETLSSLTKQTYKNWELVVVDDGSTDDTKKIIEEYKLKFDSENKITYVYQENKDQLKAIIHGLDFITGDYIFILHSDDLLACANVLENCVKYMQKNPDLDAIISDLVIIDENSKVKGKQEVLDYHISKKIPVTQLLWLGRNLYVDVGFFKKNSYIKQVKETYLTWNMPFWLTFNKNVEMLNVEKVGFEMLKYRVHSNNYINNEIGKLNVLNGELRTVTRLMRYYEIPKYNIQYIIFRIFSKLGLLNLYYPIYKNKETENKVEILKFVIQKRFPDGYQNNLFLTSLVDFYENQKQRTILFHSIYKEDEIYDGNQMRKFNTQMMEKKLPESYRKILKEMKRGFDEIVVTSDEEYEQAVRFTKFLCIYPYVKITKK